MERFNKLLQEAIEEAKQIKIPISNNINKNVKVNDRAKGRFGRCEKHGSEYIIELSLFMNQAQDDAIKQTIAHEILHTCDNCMNHQKLWKMYASMMNREYGYDITRTHSCDSLGISMQKSIKYTIECQNCGIQWHRQKMSKLIKHLERYKCSKCSSKLKLL